MALSSRIEDPAVCIVGLGACTSIGCSAPAAAAAVRAGLNTFHEHPFMIDKAGEKMIVARVDALPVELEQAGRMSTLAAAASLEALAPLRRQHDGAQVRMPAIVGLPSPRPASNPALISQLLDRLNAMEQQIGFSDLSYFSAGHSAGLMALETGFREIQSGRSDLCLIGGVDSYLDPETLEWLDETEQLHSEVNTWGFIPGEAAGFCLLASVGAAYRFGLDPLLWILSAASAVEPNLIRTDTVCLGEGLSQCVKEALRGLPSSAAKVTQTICDMNGERYRADELAFTICRTSRSFVDATAFLSPADCWGDVGAASGPLFVNLAAAASRKDYAPGPLTLIWTSSDSGERSAALLAEAA